MYGHVTVVRDDAALNREEWKFYYRDDRHRIVLDSYRKLARLSRRHGWDAGPRWDRLVQYRLPIPASDVPFPDDVAAEARSAFMSTLEVEGPCPKP
jgi:hypothetical protein